MKKLNNTIVLMIPNKTKKKKKKKKKKFIYIYIMEKIIFIIQT